MSASENNGVMVGVGVLCLKKKAPKTKQEDALRKLVYLKNRKRW